VLTPSFSHLVKIVLPTLKRMSPTLIDCAFFMKQSFMCMEQSRGITVMYGEVKTLMTLLNMKMIHQRPICGAFWWKRSYSPFFSESMVIGETFLAMMENTVLCHVEIVSQLQWSAPPHSSHPICAFLDSEFSDHWIGRRGPLPWPPHSPDLFLLDFFFCRFVRHYLLWKGGMYKWVVQQNHQTFNVLPMKCLPIPGKKLNIVFICVMLLMVPLLRSTEHIRSFVRYSV